ncbi:MAG: hypothetical protein R3244_11285, partial [Thermoanaerobaculia bacterium]|nr:hypothetical protein [Thermoanaerobaculia bacterium]
MTRRDLSLTCFVVAAVTALVLSGCQAGSTSPTDPASGELTAVSGSKGKPPGTGGGGGGGGG